ncbi:hypothetical protein [Luteipulveratus flavus]|uniref:Uncharacterized protein n=1 Tax=Luteipulveratus flavus TaxID=3031728 RepID=A0ABT6C4X8_9MICO|nr:hypothetical protein [Luteipulveratus sp. YIM 133296]MDF8263930.1 hypothetical protein [Luteipulveratus sp. YIM 133296]
MPVLHASFERHLLEAFEREEVTEVSMIADALRARLDELEDDVRSAHVYRAKSAAIQSIVSRILTNDLDFREEVVITPQDGLVSRARPDFVHQIRPGRGVIAEVERGGTVTNNHDLKDMWKTHFAPDVQHLILVVPQANWNERGVAREKPFHRVTQRMRSFFGDARREVDVLSCHVLGYGSDVLS